MLTSPQPNVPFLPSQESQCGSAIVRRFTSAFFGSAIETEESASRRCQPGSGLPRRALRNPRIAKVIKPTMTVTTPKVSRRFLRWGRNQPSLPIGLVGIACPSHLNANTVKLHDKKVDYRLLSHRHPARAVVLGFKDWITVRCQPGPAACSNRKAVRPGNIVSRKLMIYKRLASVSCDQDRVVIPCVATG